MSSEEAAQIVERFLSDNSLYPQEWNDFVETTQQDKKVEYYRTRCEDLDPLVNRPEGPDEAAVIELKSIIQALRSEDH